MSISYSERYCDDEYEYRHVTGPSVTKLLTETEVRSMGIKMSSGWEHYQLCPFDHKVYLFRRRLTDPTQCTYGKHIDALLEGAP